MEPQIDLEGTIETMNLDAGLLAAIIANPDDDLPRLQMADWLDEHGDEARAEFIRVQCESARTPQWDARPCTVCGATPCEDGEITHSRECYICGVNGGWCEMANENPAWTSLRARERELLAKQHGIEWRTIVIGGRATAYFGGSQFTRGFISAITLSAADWLRHADRITAATPLERVTLTTWPEEIGDHGRPTLHTDFYYGNMKRRWPGITFVPPAPARPATLTYGGTTVNIERWDVRGRVSDDDTPPTDDERFADFTPGDAERYLANWRRHHGI